MKNTEDLFPVINWILKKTNKLNNNIKYPSTFLLNRWLSMSTKSNAKVINETLNKWSSISFLYTDSGFVCKFLKSLLEKYTFKISYFKKNKTKTKNIDIEDNENILRECSKREIFSEKKFIAELNKMTN
jgi:hypothetical protein